MRLVGFWLVVTLNAALGCGFGDNTGYQIGGPTSCGDGVKSATEGCDDGNRAGGDGCSDACTVESANPICGNGIVETGEACDDGDAAANDACSATCEVVSACGNGTKDEGEGCDDSNTASGDGCSPTCQVEEATACSLLPQDGCGGTTPACDLTEVEDGTTECRAVSFAGTSDSRCAEATACAAGYSCVGEVGVDSSCMRFCSDDAECTGTGSRCAYTLVNDEGDSLNVNVCSNACDLVTQIGCPLGMGCIGHNATGGDYTDCAVMGTTNNGNSCDSTLDCRPGSVCVSVGGFASCHDYCRIGVSGTCGFGETCSAFASSLTIGNSSYGFCQ